MGLDSSLAAPVEALPWLLEAVRGSSLVGLGEMHGSATEHDFVRQLVSHDGFCADLVIEFGNALYQDVLDAYIKGEDVAFEELQRVCRDTTQSPINTWDNPIYAQLLATVRDANRSGGDVRVLAGDPPIDWAKVDAVEDWLQFCASRDDHYATVVENGVLRRGRHAILFIGGMHLIRSSAGGIGRRFPTMPVIMPHSGYGALNKEVEVVTSTWPAVSISRVAGTALANFTMAHFVSGILDGEGRPKQFPPRKWEDLFDYHLYLGPAVALRRSPSPTSSDPRFELELERRRRIAHSPGGIPRLP